MNVSECVSKIQNKTPRHTSQPVLCPGAGSVKMRLRRVECVGDHQWVDTRPLLLQSWYSNSENPKIGMIIYTSSVYSLYWWNHYYVIRETSQSPSCLNGLVSCIFLT